MAPRSSPLLRLSERAWAIRALGVSELSCRYGSLGPASARLFRAKPKSSCSRSAPHYRPVPQAEKAPTQKETLWAHQTRHAAQTSHPHQNRLLGFPNPRLLLKPIWSLIRNSSLGEFIHSLNVIDITPPGWKLASDGQKPNQSTQCYARKTCPFKLSSIDSDDGSELINYHLKTFCDQKKRSSRPCVGNFGSF
jgi:hypothetical protein